MDACTDSHIHGPKAIKHYQLFKVGGPTFQSWGHKKCTIMTKTIQTNVITLDKIKEIKKELHQKRIA